MLEGAHELGDEGDFDGMAAKLRDALREHPGDPYLLCWLGVAERELGLTGVAYERFRACLQARPTDPHLLATAGNGIAAFDDTEALGALRSAALLGPDLTLTRWLYGVEGDPDVRPTPLWASAAYLVLSVVVGLALGIGHDTLDR